MKKILFIGLTVLMNYSSVNSQITEIKIIPGDTTFGFGNSVSIYKDYILIGATSDDEKGFEAGAAYIFERKNNAWKQSTKLIASDGTDQDYFGHSVSISGHYAIVGIHSFDFELMEPVSIGRAYVFRCDSIGNWIEQSILKDMNGSKYDYFGYSVAISGDYAIVGAYADDDNGLNTGSAFIFKREGDNWIQQALLTASDGELGDWFGYSVSISGDYAIVASLYDDDYVENSGSAYIFKRNGDIWHQQAKLRADDPGNLDRFSGSVSISNRWAIVGAVWDDDYGKDSGSAYIFKRDGENWTQQAKLTASDAAAEDYFGATVSISYDYAHVGAYQDDDNGEDSGSAYIFKRERDTSWVEYAKLTSSDGSTDDLFGRSVAVSGNNFLVGASNDYHGHGIGSGYIFQTDPENIIALVAIDNVTKMSGSTLHLPVTASNLFGFEFFSYEMKLTYDSSILAFKNVDISNTMSSEWTTTLIQNEPGQLAIIAEGHQPLDASGTLIFIIFDVIGPDGSNTTIHFSTMTFNLGTYLPDTNDGTVYVKGVIPVEFGSFAASIQDNQVILTWSTATESNNYGFFIQRTAYKSTEWQTIGFVQGKGTTTLPQTYNFSDERVSSGTWYYRLQQQDLDGQVNYSQIIEVNLLPIQFTLFQNYPNPFNSATIIKYALPAGEHQVKLIIYDLMGHQIRTLVNNENQQAGVYQISWKGRDDDGNVVASGVYFYRLQAGNQFFIKKIVLLE